MSIQPKGVCKFGLITANPVKDQTNHKVDKCGFDWNLLLMAEAKQTRPLRVKT